MNKTTQHLVAGIGIAYLAGVLYAYYNNNKVAAQVANGTIPKSTSVVPGNVLLSWFGTSKVTPIVKTAVPGSNGSNNSTNNILGTIEGLFSGNSNSNSTTAAAAYTPEQTGASDSLNAGASRSDITADETADQTEEADQEAADELSAMA